MANKFKMTKRTVTVVLSAAVLCCSLFCAPLSASAEVTYGDWVSQSVVNGDFEAGIEGAEPYGWSKTSMNYGISASGGSVTGFYSAKNEEEISVYKDIYSKEFDLTTEVEDGNKVLSVTKNGAGYLGATSAPIAVSPSTAYSVSALFKEFADYTEYPAEPTNGYYSANTEIVIKQFTTEDTAITTDLAFTRVAAAANSDDWQTLSGTFVTDAATKYVVIYLCVGSQWKVLNTVYFDDVTIEKVGFNGDFSATVKLAEGGRTAQEDGPANWTAVSASSTATVPDSNSWPGNYKSLVTDIDGRDNVLHIRPVNKTQGYVLIQSEAIEAASGDKFFVKYDRKLTGYNDNDVKSYVVATFYDANGNVLGNEQLQNIDMRYHEDGTTSATAENPLLYDWSTVEKTISSVPANTAYFKLGFFMGGRWGYGSLNFYYDNVAVISKEVAKFNGEFDYGDVNWIKTGMGLGGGISPGLESKFVISFAAENNNKVLSLQKVNEGYVAATSIPTAVKASTSYTVSADYKTVWTDAGSNTTAIDDYGIRMYVGEKNSEGTISFHQSAVFVSSANEWKTMTKTFTTAEDTVEVIVYLWLGAAAKLQKLAYFDNVSIICNNPDVEEPFNGDFELGNIGEDTTGWQEVSMSFTDEANSYEGSYTVTNADDNGNRVMAITKTGSGYIAAKSQAYDLRAGTDYTFSFRYKHNSVLSKEAENTGGGNAYYGLACMVKEFDAEGNVLLHRAYYSPNNSGGTNNFQYTAEGIVCSDGVTEFTTDWQDVKFNLTTQANTAYAHIYFWMGGGHLINAEIYVDDVDISCLYDETDLSFVLLEGVDVDGNGETDILDLVKVKAAVGGTYNKAVDINRSGAVTLEDTLYIRAKMFGKTTYEQLKAFIVK